MKANLPDLNDLLFEQLERINDDDLTGEELKVQLEKSKMINDVARTIVSNSALMLKAARVADEYETGDGTGRRLLGCNKGSK